MSKIETLRKFPSDTQIAPEGPGSRQGVFVRDLVLEAEIGAYESEKTGTQSVRINLYLSLGANEAGEDYGDQLENVVCYDDLVKGVKAIISAGHINLVETLAEKIAAFGLEDPRVRSICVRVEKLEAISEAASVGVEIERRRD